MKNAKKLSILIPGAFLVLAACLASAAPQAPPTPADLKKISLEIAGDYIYEGGGELPFAFNVFERDGRLFGAPTDESVEELVPVKGENPLRFVMTDAESGQVFEVEFFRNEKGLIDKCVLKRKGVEFVCRKRLK